MRKRLTYWMLLLLHTLARVFYRFEWSWLGGEPERAWHDYRLVAILNHTSLYEALFAGGVPKHFVKRLAYDGVVPVASVTIERPVVGFFFRFIAGNVVSISRERDHTWEKVLASVDDKAMVLILPEGRMKRRDGLDKKGRPMTVRGGIADLIEAMGEGRMLLAYSLGMHHIQIPEETFFPRLFQPIGMLLEAVDIADYKQAMYERGGGTFQGFRKAVIADLAERRDRHCFPEMTEKYGFATDRQPHRQQEPSSTPEG